MNDNLEKGESVCSECHRAFTIKTGQPVKKWLYTYFVKASQLLCLRCKDLMIDALAKDMSAR